MRWLAALLLLAAPAAAQDRDVAELLTFAIGEGGTVTRQEAIPDGCELTVAIFEAIPDQPPRQVTGLRLWLGDWLLGDVAAEPARPEMARLLMVLRHPPLPQDADFYQSAVLVMEDHLAAAHASGLGFGAWLEEANRMAGEIADRGIAGEFGALAARNFAERIDYHPGGLTEYQWQPVSAVALRVPIERAGAAMAALAAHQAAACF